LRQIVAAFVPSFFQSQATASINSKQGRTLVVDGVKRVLLAAEAVRAKASQTAAAAARLTMGKSPGA